MLDKARGKPGQARLRKHSEYQRTYRASKKYFSASMTFFFAERNEEPGQGPRIGITAGRAFGKAVDRNRAKRRVREAIRANLGSFAEDVDVVLHPRRTVLAMESTRLRTEISQIFSEIRKAIVSRKAGK